MKKQVAICAILTSLAGCGGGGGSSAPAAPVSINAAEAFKSFVGTTRTISNLPITDSSLGTATLIVREEENYPFVTNGTSQQTFFSKVIQFQRSDSNGKLQFQNIWKFHLDAQMKPIGIAGGPEFAKYNECQSVSSKTDLPTSTNSSGIFFSGFQTINYAETFKSGTYAHYCDPTATIAVKNVEWSVMQGSPNPYFCLTMPASFNNLKTRMCIPVDGNGALGTAAWISLYTADGALASEYKAK
ncbi:MAG: hypothetical protein V4724_26830 [Pseudomonadota bacterium]